MGASEKRRGGFFVQYSNFPGKYEILQNKLIFKKVIRMWLGTNTLIWETDNNTKIKTKVFKTKNKSSAQPLWLHAKALGPQGNVKQQNANHGRTSFQAIRH